MSLSRFVETLLQLDNELDATDIADVLWLARFMQNRIAEVATDPVPPVPPTEPAGPGVEPSPAPVSVPTESEKPPAPSLEIAPFSSENSKANPKGSGRLDFRSPAAHALPARLGMSRALRPFRRRVPAQRDFELDERATVQRVAEQGRQWPITPVLRPRPSRWLELTLVVDSGASMKLWRQTLREFTVLLEGLGAFSRVQLWSMGTDRADGLTFQPGFRATGGATGSLRSSLPVTQNTTSVVMLLTDGVSAAWHSGQVGRWLKAQGQRRSVVVVQLLPPSLWIRTAFGPPLSGLCYPAGPVAPNRRLELLTTDNRLFNPPDLQSVVVPVLTLEENQLASWARLVVRGEPAWLPVLVLDDQKLTRPQESRHQLPEPAPPTDDERLAFFEANASPLAQRLAALLSAAPVTLPVVRLIQQTMLPQARTSHQAEVFLGGLLQKRADHPDPDYVEYEFIGELREMLAARLSKLDNLKVLRQVSDYIGRRSGHPFDFRAFLLDPSQTGEELAVGGLPFARVAAEVLERLGEPFRQASARLRTLEQQTPVPPAFPRSPGLLTAKPTPPETSSADTTGPAETDEAPASDAGLQIPFHVTPDEPTREVVDSADEYSDESDELNIINYLDDYRLAYNDKVKQVMLAALQIAGKYDHISLGTSHVLFGLLEVPDNTALDTLINLDLPVENIRNTLNSTLTRTDRDIYNEINDYNISNWLEEVLQHAQREANYLSLTKTMDTAHLLLGLLRAEAGTGGGVLRGVGLTYDLAIQAIPNPPITGPTSLTVFDFLAEKGIKPSDEVRSALILAQRVAHSYSRTFLSVNDLLLGLLEAKLPKIDKIITFLELDINTVRKSIIQTLPQEWAAYNADEYGLNSWSRRALEFAISEATLVGNSKVGSIEVEHFLLGILSDKENPDTQSELNAFGLSYNKIAKVIYSNNNLANFAQLNNTNDLETYIAQADEYLRVGRFDLAVEAYTHAIELEPDNDHVYHNRGHAYYALRDYDQAMGDYNTALSIYPDNAFCYLDRGELFEKLEQYEQALNDYNKVIDIDPNISEAFNKRGKSYERLEHYEQALEDYNWAIALEPNADDAYYNRGRVYFILERYEQALSDYNMAIEIDPSNPFYYNDRGEVHEKLQQYEQALLDYVRIIEVYPDNPNLYYKRGQVYEHLGLYNEALMDYKLADRLDPTRPIAYQNIEHLEMMLKEYGQDRP